MRCLLIIIITVFIFQNNTSGQTPTIGLLNYDDASEGYTLFSPEQNRQTYLINNCGEVVNEWTSYENPGITSYLREDGTLLRVGLDSLQIRDWNSNLIWSYALLSNGITQHHDIEPMPNGNILCIVRDQYTNIQMEEAGRNPDITATNFRLDKIIELEPIGTNDAQIVWEWTFFDHLIQEFDNTKQNFGVVVDHPELLDINFDNVQNSDMIHLNSVDYNADLDQIILSSRSMSEIYIIDHSTTTAEAAGHSGGNFNKGGDFLWRWGNPQTYQQGTASDQKLFRQHDAKWVQNGYFDHGKISVFNNLGDGNGTFSSIHLVEPSIVNNSYEMENGKFAPIEDHYSWAGDIEGQIVFSSKKSGVQALKNGNLLLCETNKGQISEITQSGDIVWTYKNPSGNGITPQYSTSTSGIFRAEKYPVDYIGLQGQDLTPQGIIESENSLSNACVLVGINEIEEIISIQNPVINKQIIFSNPIQAEKISLININGQIMLEQKNVNTNLIELSKDLILGMYFLQIQSKGNTQTIKVIIE